VLALACVGSSIAWCGGGGGTDSGNPEQACRRAIAIGAGSTTIRTFEGHTCAVLEDGTVRCWGANNEGQLGDGNATPRTDTNKYAFDSDVPREVPGVTNAVAMAGGIYHTVVLLRDGTVRAWGNNRYGQLGNGAKTQSFTPVEVRLASGQLLSNVVEIAAGDYHSVARLKDGTVWSWGWNLYGQLGDGTQVDSPNPVQVIGLPAAATALTARFRGSGVILADANRTMRLWGDNEGGQLGIGNNDGRFSTPVQPLVIADAVALDAGDHHNMVVLGNGQIWAWGRNAEGQLGDGTGVASPLPVQVKGINNAVAVTGGDIHSCALLADRTAKCWGRNVAGELGNGRTGSSKEPVNVLNLTTFSAVVAGGLSSHGLLADGTVWGWGQNAHGQLGNGRHGLNKPDGSGADQEHSAVPVQVVGIGCAGGSQPPPPAGTAAAVPAASLRGNVLARESLVSVFGVRVATTTMSASSASWPESLAGTSVKVTDAQGRDGPAKLFFVSAAQVNFLLPAGTAKGPARITVTAGDGATSAANAEIAEVSPGLFSANGDGQGVAAALAVRVAPDGAQTIQPVFRLDPASGKQVGAPLDFGSPSDQLILSLFGTGLRHRSSLAAVGVRVGGEGAEVLFAGPQVQIEGLDQVNVRLPRSLAGRGEVTILLTVDGQVANPVTVNLGAGAAGTGGIGRPLAGPAGAYVLNQASLGPSGGLLNAYNDAITAETNSGKNLFVGFVLRVRMEDLITNDNDTSGAIQYDFSPIIDSLTAIQRETRGIRAARASDPVTLQVLVWPQLVNNTPQPPPILLAQIPANERYVNNGVTLPVPWSPAAVKVLKEFYTALANTPITDYSQPGNPQVLLKDHPTLRNINVAPIGHKGYRDNNSSTKIPTIAGYDRDRYVSALLSSVAAAMTAFPNDFGFMEYFGFSDRKDSQYGGETLDQRVDRELDPLYNGPGQSSFGVWRENLGDYSPSVASGQNLLDYEGPGFVNDPEGHVLFQSIRNWAGAQPAFGENATKSGSPANGMMFGYTQYGARYLEVYGQDITLKTSDIKLAFEDILGHPASDAEAANIRVILEDLLVAWNEYLVNGPGVVADSATVKQGSAANTISVLANDTRPPGPSPWHNPSNVFPTEADLLKFTITAVTQGAHGSVQIAANGTAVTYTPAAGFSGADSFTYTVSDGYGGRATAPVGVTVVP